MKKNRKSILAEIAVKVLSRAKKLGADSAEAVIWKSDEELSRFANSEIHQSVSSENSGIHIRVVIGKKIGVSRTNRLDDAGITGAVTSALTLAKLQKPDPHFRSLPDKSPGTSRALRVAKGKHIGASGRADAIKHIISQAEKAGLVASGAFSETDGETYVANSNGIRAYHTGTSASLTTILMGDKGSGFASHSSHGGRDIKFKDVARTAVSKASQGELIEVPPGEYEVILEPPAVAEILDFFAWLGPNARIFHEDVSFYQGNLGKRLFHSSLTISDDPLHPLGYPMPFDYEGTPKKPLKLVENGVLTRVVYDSYHARKYNKENTGHALLAPNTWGPIPTHLVVHPGDKSPQQLVQGVKRGLLVTRFWYTRVVQHKQLTLTGMTRDGTFFIENGKIVGRVKNLRYTQSIVEALKDVRGIGKLLELHGSEGSPSLVPHVHLGKFRFTGVTKHG